MTSEITPYITVVTPVYGCGGCLEKLYQRLSKVLSEINPHHEIIMVNDASPDNCWSKIVELSRQDSRVKGINLSRNFGQHYAITAGLDHAKGQWVVVMDCDLQENPEDIHLLYNEAQKGFDVVLGRRALRNDGFFKKWSSNLFTSIFNYLTEIKRDPQVAFFVIFSRNVCDSLISMREHARFMPSLLDWTGFSKSYIDVSHNSGGDRKSGYNFKKLFNLAFDAIVSHSNKPLKLIIKYGFMMSISSVVVIAYLLFRYLTHSIYVSGWTSVIVSIWFLSGNILATLGVLGIYIGKIFNDVKGRPLYIIKEKTFLE